VDSERLAGVLGVTGGLAGILAGLVLAVAGQALVGEVDRTLGASLALTEQALEAVDEALAVGATTLPAVDAALEGTRVSAQEAGAALTSGAQTARSTADVTGTAVADSVEAVQASIPALIQVATAVDGSLRALDALPFGPPYEAEQPFDDAVRDLGAALEGVPDDLRGQAEGLRRTADALAETGATVTTLESDLAQVRDGLADADAVLASSAATARDAHVLLERSRVRLGRRTTATRAAVVVVGLAFAVGQAATVVSGRRLLAEARAFEPERDDRESGAGRAPRRRSRRPPVRPGS